MYGPYRIDWGAYQRLSRERDQARERLLREQEEELHARPGDDSYHP